MRIAVWMVELCWIAWWLINVDKMILELLPDISHVWTSHDSCCLQAEITECLQNWLEMAHIGQLVQHEVQLDVGGWIGKSFGLTAGEHQLSPEDRLLQLRQEDWVEQWVAAQVQGCSSNWFPLCLSQHRPAQALRITTELYICSKTSQLIFFWTIYIDNLRLQNPSKSICSKSKCFRNPFPDRAPGQQTLLLPWACCSFWRVRTWAFELSVRSDCADNLICAVNLSNLCPKFFGPRILCQRRLPLLSWLKTTASSGLRRGEAQGTWARSEGVMKRTATLTMYIQAWPRRHQERLNGATIATCNFSAFFYLNKLWQCFLWSGLLRSTEKSKDSKVWPVATGCSWCIHP